jgi:hypothetical protein
MSHFPHKFNRLSTLKSPRSVELPVSPHITHAEGRLPEWTPNRAVPFECNLAFAEPAVTVILTVSVVAIIRLE